MRFIRDTKIQFMRYRRLYAGISLTLFIISIALISLRGLNFGVDFTGGIVVELGYPETVELEQIRNRLSIAGFEEFEAQHFGSGKDVVVRLAPDDTRRQSDLSDFMLRELRHDEPAVQLRRVEFVGPKVGEELREDGGLALLYALIGILVYVAFRFEYRFAFGAVIALVHDVVLTLGFFSLTAINFDLSVLAAMLAVIGYSLNDTIVVYDRIRENFLKQKKALPEKIVNLSINRTLARTLITSLTTLMVLVALLVFGGEGIAPFTIAMMAGVIIGTYSSIYIAGAALLMFGLSGKDMAVVKKEGEEFGRV